jgi:hypothetical protein
MRYQWTCDVYTSLIDHGHLQVAMIKNVYRLSSATLLLATLLVLVDILEAVVFATALFDKQSSDGILIYSTYCFRHVFIPGRHSLHISHPPPHC